MKLKWINRYDDLAKRRRICTLTGCRGTVGDGKGYSWKLTLSLRDWSVVKRQPWRSIKEPYRLQKYWEYKNIYRLEYGLLWPILSYTRSYGGVYA